LIVLVGISCGGALFGTPTMASLTENTVYWVACVHVTEDWWDGKTVRTEWQHMVAFAQETDAAACLDGLEAWVRAHATDIVKEATGASARVTRKLRLKPLIRRTNLHCLEIQIPNVCQDYVCITIFRTNPLCPPSLQHPMLALQYGTNAEIAALVCSGLREYAASYIKATAHSIVQEHTNYTADLSSSAGQKTDAEGAGADTGADASTGTGAGADAGADAPA
jgi:hypothetical protein